jgi:hypothetical protein
MHDVLGVGCANKKMHIPPDMMGGHGARTAEKIGE